MSLTSATGQGHLVLAKPGLECGGGSKTQLQQINAGPSDSRGEAKRGLLGQGVLTITMLARWAETSAYTPPEEPTTGAVMSATDTAKDPGTERDGELKDAGVGSPAQSQALGCCSLGAETPEREARSLPPLIPCHLGAS